jgi:cyclic pyranopterin monophosphate synthase
LVVQLEIRVPQPNMSFTHLDAEGRARMVDVGGKEPTDRVAVAEGVIRMSRATVDAIRSHQTPKGNVLQISEIAGIMMGKRTGELIPLCHPLPLHSLDVRLEIDTALPGVRATAVARVHARTGVEMEALTAVAGALLTVYDMCKAVDRGMTIEGVRLLRKEGGRSGTWVANPEDRADADT